MIILKKQTKIGIVFNTDPSTKGGQHWISLYVDVGKHNNPFSGCIILIHSVEIRQVKLKT